MLDVSTLNLIAGLVIPLLVALVSKRVASSGVKGLLNALLSAIAGIIVVGIDNNGAFEANAVLNAGIATFVTSISAYYGIWKPTGVAQGVRNATADFGVVGPDISPQDDLE